MGIRKIKYGVLFLLMITLSFLFIQPAHPADELFLTGIVKSVDPATRTVFIDVKSSSCRGMRKFSLPDDKALAEFDDFKKQKVDFVINSSICKSGEVYGILPNWRLRK